MLPGLSWNLDAVLMQRMQCPIVWMQYVMTDDAVLMKVHAVSHNVEALWCVVVCSDDEGECSDTSVMAVCQQCHLSWIQCCCSGFSAPALPGNVDAVPRQ